LLSDETRHAVFRCHQHVRPCQRAAGPGAALVKAFFPVLLLFTLAGCNPVLDAPAKPASSAASGKPLPYAPPPPPLPDEVGACAADVRQCPDGSFVSRSPATSCRFDPCPGETPNQ
jgi:hypothetical protein